MESRVCWSLGSSQISMPRDWALVSLEPAFSPAMRRLVDLETEPVILAPRDSRRSVRSVRLKSFRVPVRTIVLPAKGESMVWFGSRWSLLVRFTPQFVRRVKVSVAAVEWRYS